MATLLRPDTAPQWIDTTPQPMPALSAKPIEGSRYWSREFMDREWEGIWTKSWLIGGLAAQVAKPGDFFTYDIGRESILVTHGDDGQIRGLAHIQVRVVQRLRQRFDGDRRFRAGQCPHRPLADLPR